MWVYKGICALTSQQQVMLLEDIKIHPWFGMHDNMNIPFRAFQQWLGNRNHFDSGMVATILVLKNPHVHWPDRNFRIQQKILGAKNLISDKDIVMLKVDSGLRLFSHVISLVL